MIIENYAEYEEKLNNAPIALDSDGHFNLAVHANSDSSCYIAQIEKGNIFEGEHNGDTFSFKLPRVMFSCDLEELSQFLCNFNSIDELKAKMSGANITEFVEFFGDYIDGEFEPCESDEEMHRLFIEHGDNSEAIQEAIRSDGGTYINLDMFVDGWLKSLDE